jgi:adenylyltransferase/sulfurtransferase
MAVTVLIPAALRQHTAAKDRVVLEASTVDDVLRRLCEQFPSLRPHLTSEDGAVRPFVNVYVNEQDIRFLAALHTPVTSADVVSIIPSIAGG